MEDRNDKRKGLCREIGSLSAFVATGCPSTANLRKSIRKIRELSDELSDMYKGI